MWPGPRRTSWTVRPRRGPGISAPSSSRSAPRCGNPPSVVTEPHASRLGLNHYAGSLVMGAPLLMSCGWDTADILGKGNVVSNESLANLLKEERRFAPPAELAERANVTSKA